MIAPVERRDLSGEWLLTFDESAPWQDIPLYLPGTSVQRMSPSAPTNGWSSLDSGQPITVPSVAETIRHGYHGVTWWSREIDLPKQAGATLHFGGVRLLVEVYWDRKLIGYDLEGSTPFAVELPFELCTAGQHRLDVRVINPGGSDNWEDIWPIQWAGHLLPSSHDFGGIWQPVSIELHYGARILDLYARPNRNLDAALVDVAIETKIPLQGEVTLQAPDGAIVVREQRRVSSGSSTFHVELPVSAPLLYNLGAPNLYLVVMTLRDEERVVDMASRQVGFRLLTSSDDGLLYNDEPFYLRTAISWSWYADGPVPAPDELRAEVASILALGQNCVSAHRSVSTPALQTALEAQGLLLYQEPGGGPSLRPQDGSGKWLPADKLDFAISLMEARIRRLARRDRSRPCLVWWNLANEVFDVDVGDPGEPARRLMTALRNEDDSRLSTWTSAWGPTIMFRPFDATPRRSFDFHMVLNWPTMWNSGIERDVLAVRPPRPMPFLSGESSCMSGLGGIPELARRYPDNVPSGSAGAQVHAWVAALTADLAAIDPESRLGGVEGFCAGTADTHAYSVARLVETTRANPSVNGLAINGWHSHPNIGGMGIVRLDRRPAFNPLPVARANAALALALLGLKPQIRVGENQLDCQVVLLDDANAMSGPVILRTRLLQNGQELWSDERRVEPTRTENDRVKHLGGLHLPTPATGPLTVEVSVQCGECIVFTDAVFRGCEVAPLSGHRVALHDPLGDLGAWLLDRGVETTPWMMDNASLGTFINATSLRALHTLFYGPSRRTAMLVRKDLFARSHPQMIDFRQLGLAGESTPTEIPMRGDWLGTYGFTLGSSVLPSLGNQRDADVWDWTHSTIFPEVAIRGLQGDILTGAASFPEGTFLSAGIPAVGATTVLLRRGAHELLLTTLPLAEKRFISPLAEAVLADIIRWLGGQSA